MRLSKACGLHKECSAKAKSPHIGGPALFNVKGAGQKSNKNKQEADMKKRILALFEIATTMALMLSAWGGSTGRIPAGRQFTCGTGAGRNRNATQGIFPQRRMVPFVRRQ